MPGQQKRQEFAEVVDATYKRIFRGALSVTGDRHLAEEIVQETFVLAFRKFDSFSGRSSAFAWLYGIMLNKYRDHCRRRKLLKRLGFVRANADPGGTKDSEAVDSSLADELANHDESEFLMKAVDGLPFSMRTVIAMHYFDDLTLREIAEILNCRLGTIKSRLFNARKRLYQALRGKVRNG
ncbi:RNA polymerase sigma factor [bacterium]|nr:RNA polymerase sigma factor [bacterium]